MTVLERLQQKRGEPAREIARLFPVQGEWTVEEYLALETNQLVEFSNGFVEVLPMPSPSHQRIALFLYRILWAFITERRLGEVLVAPLPVELWAKKSSRLAVASLVQLMDSSIWMLMSVSPMTSYHPIKWRLKTVATILKLRYLERTCNRNCWI